MKAHLASLAALSLLVLDPPSALAGVLVVDGPPGALQAAIDASAEGDVLLVRGGPYSSCRVVGKSLAIVAEPSGSVAIDASSTLPLLSLSGLAVGQRCTIAGLDVRPGVSNPAPRIEACAGSVRLQSVRFLPQPGDADGLVVSDSTDVALVRCEISGAEGAGSSCCGGHAGGAGLSVAGSRAALYDLSTTGGNGENTFVAFGQPTPAGPGGPGVEVRAGSTVLASALATSGGAGGNGSGGACLFGSCTSNGMPGGPGGAGLDVDLASSLWLLDVLAAGGAGGSGAPIPACCGGGATPDGRDGAPIAGAPNALSGASVALDAPTHVRELQPIPITIHGAPGDQAVLLVAADPSWQLDLARSGVLLQGPTARRLLLGTIPASGALQATLAAPALPAGVDARIDYLQALTVGTGGVQRLGSFAVLVVLDSAF